ncbi:chloride channel protein [Seleniivibrio woodruffii]|uniref:CIC family chloride channel protein n=1 Tax=Seleniivibrio woodruffii TaxID=1078050 RepID=A0A4R1KBM4_9BACT|nr:chloride channel protein [Seleniivibrio woodruffii]TCK61882.1 CIC family chloride channel protein [Seleniivibrio woodruffii]TVZ35003.1 CIC family chloride channel protein [Seleniivibrio woodruffii]
MKRFKFKKLTLPVVGRWFILGSLVGIFAGLASIALFFMIQACEFYFLDSIVGWPVGETSGEPSLFGHSGKEFNRWLLLIIPALGGLVSGYIVYRFAPEAQGAGTNTAIDAIHQKKGNIRWQVPIVKIFTSAITIGTGGSGGREGPISHIGAGFASFLGNTLSLTDREKRILTAAGMGAGVGAIFRSPLAGAIFAAEVLYSSSDMEYEALLPSAITSIIAYSVFCSVFGWEPLFAAHNFSFRNPAELLGYTVLGFACAFFGWLFVNIYQRVSGYFKKLNIRPYLKPMIGGFITGCIAILIPEVLSGGYAQIDHAMSNNLGLMFLVLFIFAKIFATAFTIGSGGSAGSFGPSMVIGACVGGMVGVSINMVLPVVAPEPGAYAVVGMAGFFSGVANTPLSTIIMVSEMTGNYHLLVPSMWVSTLTFLLLRKTLLYPAQVPQRSDSPAHKGEFFLQVLQDIKVRNVMRTDPITIPETMKFSDVVHFIARTKHNNFPVLKDDGTFAGVLLFEELREFVFEEGLEDIVVAGEVCEKDIPFVIPETTLADAIDSIGFKNVELLPVLDPADHSKLLGIITRRDIITTYNKMIRRRQMAEREKDDF